MILLFTHLFQSNFSHIPGIAGKPWFASGRGARSEGSRGDAFQPFLPTKLVLLGKIKNRSNWILFFVTPLCRVSSFSFLSVCCQMLPLDSKKQANLNKFPTNKVLFRSFPEWLCWHYVIPSHFPGRLTMVWVSWSSTTAPGAWISFSRLYFFRASSALDLESLRL